MDRSTRTLIVTGVLISFAVAAGLSQLASDAPDGLEYVAEEQGFDGSAEAHDLADSPLADYGATFVDDEGLGTAIAGIIGVAVTLAVGWVLFRLVVRRDPSASA
jgi:hypothetical protein